MDPGQTISVELVQDEGGGSLFLDDICNMFERIAERVGLPLQVAARTLTSRSYRLAAALDLPYEIDREIGVHRGQLVPEGSVSGRIVTAKVIVRTDLKQNSSASKSVLKTSNYPTRRVAIHETGEVAPLDVVLSGSA